MTANTEPPWHEELAALHKDGPVGEGPDAPFDPLRLCIYATIAFLGWAFGPFAVLVFAALGFAGYWRARKAGLKRSQCYLRDTRLVLAYLAILAVAGTIGAASITTGQTVLSLMHVTW